MRKRADLARHTSGVILKQSHIDWFKAAVSENPRLNFSECVRDGLDLFTAAYEKEKKMKQKRFDDTSVPTSHEDALPRVAHIASEVGKSRMRRAKKSQESGSYPGGMTAADTATPKYIRVFVRQLEKLDEQLNASDAQVSAYCQAIGNACKLTPEQRKLLIEHLSTL